MLTFLKNRENWNSLGISGGWVKGKWRKSYASRVIVEEGNGLGGRSPIKSSMYLKGLKENYVI